jgi:glutamate N-acetyltransferase/amino-acid N-acetyltransferase
MKFVDGGVTAAKGFLASGLHSGIRKNRDKKDLALIFCEAECNAAAVYTLNKVKGSPLIVTEKNLTNGKARAVIVNSGNANTCNADGELKAELMCEYTANALNIDKSDVIVASTGVIGQILPIEPIREGIPKLAEMLSKSGSPDAAEAIMTTDLCKKELAIEFTLGGKTCFLGGIAKGSGMIHPNMATMLGFLTTDVNITEDMLKLVLKATVVDTYNMVSVDGDTSTNDMVSIMASGLAKNKIIDTQNEDFFLFVGALNKINIALCRAIAKDGEGATKLLTCVVTNSPDKEIARQISKTVITSSLLKAAMFGADANWGRVLCAIGYAPVDIDVKRVDVEFASSVGNIAVCKNGAGLDFDEEKAKKILLEEEININININAGKETATAWGCDLTYDYVKINGDYRT